MSDNIICDFRDVLINPATFDTDTITLSKPAGFYKVEKNISVYHKKEPKATEDSPLKSKLKKKILREKIRILTPKLSVKKVVEFTKLASANTSVDEDPNKMEYQMFLSFRTLAKLYNEEEVKIFYSFIKKIDSLIEETILSHREQWGLPKKMKYRRTLRRSRDSVPYHMGINLPYDENKFNTKPNFLFKTFNESATDSDISIIKKKSVVAAILELSDIWFGADEFGINWNVMQIRKFKPYSPIQEFLMTRCVIPDHDDPEDQAYKMLIDKYKRDLDTKFPALMAPHIDEAYAQFCQMNKLTQLNQIAQMNQISQLNQMAQMKQLQHISQMPPGQIPMGQMGQMFGSSGPMGFGSGPSPYGPSPYGPSPYGPNPYGPNPFASNPYFPPRHNESEISPKLRLEGSSSSANNSSQQKQQMDFLPPSESELIAGIKSLKKTVTVDKSNFGIGKVVGPTEGRSQGATSSGADRCTLTGALATSAPEDKPMAKGNPPPPPPMNKNNPLKTDVKPDVKNNSKSFSPPKSNPKSSRSSLDTLSGSDTNTKSNIKSKKKGTKHNSSTSESEPEAKVKKSKPKTKSKNKK